MRGVAQPVALALGGMKRVLAGMKGQRSFNIYYLNISVDSWPTLHTSTVRMTL